MTRPLGERVADRLQPEGDCLLWTGARNDAGYGQVGDGGRLYYVHRVMWEWWHGRPIPQGHHIDHLCRTTLCANAEHLELVTHGENIRRGNAHHRAHGTGRYGKTTCRRGHPRVVGQTCKPCAADAQRRRRAAKKAAKSEGES